MQDINKSDEIDLIQIIETVWEGKWKIISITIVCVMGVLCVYAFGPAPTFVATTEIKPISESDAEEYRQSNALEFFAIYRDDQIKKVALVEKEEIPSAVLYKLFVEQLGNRPLLASIFEKHELLERASFSSDRDYERALLQLASRVLVMPASDSYETQSGESRPHWNLQFEFNDEGVWFDALAELKNIANNNVRTTIRYRFENLLKSAEQKRAFDLEDLDSEISILIATYDAEIASKIAYLKEQAAIARELGISKQTSIPQPSIYQNLNTGNTESIDNRPSNIETLYLRGFDALEKEIELIKSRQDKRAFIPGLQELEQEKLALLKDQTLERAERLFANTPVMNSTDFQAVSFDIGTTNVNYGNKRKLMVAMAAMLGGLIGVVYVLIASMVRRRR